MNKKQYADYMLTTIANNLQQQIVFANTWPEVAKAIEEATDRVLVEHKLQMKCSE